MIKPAIYLLSPTAKADTISLPMIRFQMSTEKIAYGECDTLLFTSKQAVVQAEKIDPSWKKLPSIAVGSATKKQIESLGGKVIYYPESYYGKHLAKDITLNFSDKKILYLRPKEVSTDIKELLRKEGIEISEQVIYETSCISYPKEQAPVKNAVIIFTSPSTVHCFLKNFEWDESYQAVVIGESTKSHLLSHMQYVVADKPLIDSCIQKAKSLSRM
jgi:uroporphyrinogen-III synthase